MTAAVTQNKRAPVMQPWLLVGDVNVNQHASFNFDTFPNNSMFMGSIAPTMQNLTKPFQPSPNSRDDQDWKVFFEQFKDTNAKTATPTRETSPVTNIVKEKRNLFSKESNSDKLSSQINSKQAFDSSYPSSQHNYAQTPEQKQSIACSSTNKTSNPQFEHSNQTCVGLTDFIRRNDKKEFLCERCGSTHSNCVIAKTPISSAAKQVLKFRLRRACSVSSAASKKVIVICPNCGKRSHTCAIPSHIQNINYYRSLTWPLPSLPLERIVEDETEAHCCSEEDFIKDSDQLNGKLFRSSASRISSDTDCKMITCAGNCNVKKLQPESLPNRKIEKILIAELCPSALTHVNSMRRWARDKHEDGKLIHFVALVTPNNKNLHPDLMRSVDSQVIVGELSNENNLDYEDEVIVQAAKTSEVQAVWISNYTHDKHEALKNSLNEVGIQLYSSSSSTDISSTETNQSFGGLPKTNIPLRISGNGEKNGVINGNRTDLIDDEISTRFNIVATLSAAVHITHQLHQSRLEKYMHALKSEQIIPASFLSHTDFIELMYLKNKFLLQSTKLSTSRYHISCGTSFVEVDANRCNEDGWLLSFDGVTYTTYVKECLKSYNITVDGQVHTFDKSRSSESSLQIMCNGETVAFDSFASNDYKLSNEMEKLNCKSNKSCQKIDVSNEKSLQVLNASHNMLSLVMKGWCYPADVFEARTTKTLKDLITSLNDPSLPLLQMQDALISTNGCLPPPAERHIRKEMSRYASNITSMMTTFPGAKIQKIIQSFAKTLSKKSDHYTTFCDVVKPILQVVDRFSKGFRGNMKNVLLSLLREYYKVEAQFQQSSFEQSVLALLRNHDASSVFDYIRSHSFVSQKNFLALQLIKNLKTCENIFADDDLALLEKISCLSHEDNSKVALSARQVLRSARKIPYELRYNQLDSLFFSMSGSYNDAIFKSISDVDTFELLPQFFVHAKLEVRMVAMEIYVRRAYSPCQLASLQHHHVTDDVSALLFNYSISRGSSSCSNEIESELTALHCVEVMAAFSGLEMLQNCLCEVIQVLDANSVRECSKAFSNEKPTFIEENQRRTISVVMPTADDALGDEAFSQLFYDFLKSHEIKFREANLQRVTFLVFSRNRNAKYFAFELKEQHIEEDLVLRHVDPYLACELRLKGLLNHPLEVLPSKQDLHLYLSSHVGEKKVHVLGAIRDPSAGNEKISLDVFHNDTELLLLEALDDLEELASELYHLPKRVFINVIKNMKINEDIVETRLKSLIIQYGNRLWKRNVKEIEISYGSRSDSDFLVPSVIRIFLLSETECCFE